MRITFILALLALMACGQKGQQSSTPPNKTVTLVEKKDCIATPSDMEKLLGSYPSRQILYVKVADWALTLAHDQDCTINDDTRFFGDLEQYLIVHCSKDSKDSCEIKLKNKGNL